MALGAIELGTIARSQDYTTLKQNEDNKGISQQSNLVQEMHREADNRTRQVVQSDNADWQKKKFDSKEKGSNSYAGDGGRNRKKQAPADGVGVGVSSVFGVVSGVPAASGVGVAISASTPLSDIPNARALSLISSSVIVPRFPDVIVKSRTVTRMPIPSPRR